LPKVADTPDLRHFAHDFVGYDTELVPGIRAVASPGHTAGHTLYVIESKGQKLVLEPGDQRKD
jgi:glyoxylase-like metal-dependent hydrolase (beta-lactamase superfamily II)